MACRLCRTKSVWKFTNQQQLCASCFARYFESKVKKIIRKYQMPISILRNKSLKAEIINKIIKELKLPKSAERKGRLSDENLNDISNKILENIIFSNMSSLKNYLPKFLPKNQPLYFLSDEEILLYARIKKIRGKINEPKKRLVDINNFIKKIEEKNPDIRHNIVDALLKSKNEK